MTTRVNKYTYNLLMVLLVAVMAVPLLVSCGKSSDGTVNGFNSQLIVANLSPDILPIDIYINNVSQNGITPYRYPTLSSYFYLNTIGSRIQIRSDTGQKSQLLLTDSIPNRNAKYTLFVTGLKADGKLGYIFAVDTAVLPAVGQGKLRFINASPRSSNFDIYANGAIAFTNMKFDTVSKYVALPAGDYDFKIYANGDRTAILNEVKQTIGDGKLYTLYTYGIVGRTDSAAFASGVITNK